jgi:uncharacterized membrane protein HdeD (DUF308 family)
MNTIDDMNLRALKQLKENWNWYLLLGISLVILGTFAVIFSYATTIFSVIYLGIFFLVIGVIEGVHSFKLTQWGNFFLHLFLGILYFLGGLSLILYPTINAVSLTLLIGIFLIVSGILKIFFAFSKRTPHKGLLAFSGVLTIILGILILYQWPVSGLWVIGMFVGIDAIVTGWTWIFLSLQAKKLK